MFNQATRAIEPALSLQRMIRELNGIPASLADPPRCRRTQLENHLDT